MERTHLTCDINTRDFIKESNMYMMNTSISQFQCICIMGNVYVMMNPSIISLRVFHGGVLEFPTYGNWVGSNIHHHPQVTTLLKYVNNMCMIETYNVIVKFTGGK